MPMYRGRKLWNEGSYETREAMKRILTLPGSILPLAYTANELEAWCKHNDKWPFQGEFSNSWFFWCGFASTILKIFISFVYMKLGGLLPGAGKVHLKYFNKKLV